MRPALSYGKKQGASFFWVSTCDKSTNWLSVFFPKGPCSCMVHIEALKYLYGTAFGP